MRKLFIGLALICSACANTPLKPGDGPDPNPRATGDPAADKRVVLPRETNEYLDHLDWLVGLVCFTVPHENSCTNATLQCSVRALKESAGCSSPQMQRLDRVILNSKFEGKTATNVSFLAGAIDVGSDDLVEAVVQEDSQAQIKPDTACIDKGKINVPARWCNAVWESSITRHVISYRQYKKFSSNSGAGYAAINAGNTTYISNDSLNVTDYITGYALPIDDLLSCDRDSVTQICKRKSAQSAYSSLPNRSIASSTYNTDMGETVSPESRTLTDSEVKALSRATIKTNDENKSVFSAELKDELSTMKSATANETKKGKPKKSRSKPGQPADGILNKQDFND